MATTSFSFDHGVASGDPHRDSVILWTRVTPSAGVESQIEVAWEASLTPTFEQDSIKDSGTFATSSARDWTVKVEAEGLESDTIYFYRFRVGDATSAVGQTKTLPVGSDPVRLAVFSCANYTAAEQFAAYGRAADTHAVNPYDALVHLGDYIYEYGPGGYGAAEDAATDRGFLPNREIVSLDDYRQRYAQYHTDSNLQALRAAAPLIAIWDDHETANDSWSGGAENHQSETEGNWSERRDAALKAYYEWLPIREPNLREGADQGNASTLLSQGYRSFTFGDVLALHVLETRLSGRDEQLAYPDAAAVQARIGAILADPALVTSYASKAKLEPPASQEAIAAFATALAPVVTQELVLATVQQAWGDPDRDLIGDTQLAWLQQQMGASTAAWQVLGQQVLMQSMAVPAELLLNAGDPALLDKYAAPLQKLATGTDFKDLSPSEQALFAEAGKIPYNLDAWDGYGVERETILQTAQALGKRLISLAGDTHNAWAGVLDTMSAGSKPAGTVAGVEFATPGVTSPGLEKYLPGADAYIRAKYPAVDGLDGLFMGYVNGLKYADLNRRGFLDLTVTTEQAIGNFQLLNGTNALTDQPQWASETVLAATDFSLASQTERTSTIAWNPTWRELDLKFGIATTWDGEQLLLNPSDYATLPREGVELADVQITGSSAADRIFTGIGSVVDAAAGNDSVFNSDSQGGNILVGGQGGDLFYLGQAKDRVIGGTLLNASSALALVDNNKDQFFLDLDGSKPNSGEELQILDFEVGTDSLLADGNELATTADRWLTTKQTLLNAGFIVNAAPTLQPSALESLKLVLIPGLTTVQNLSAVANDPDGEALSLLLLQAPSWFKPSGSALTIETPESFTAEQLADLKIELALSDQKSVVAFTPKLELASPPPGTVSGQPVVSFTDTNGNLRTFAINAAGGSFTDANPAQLLTTSTIIDRNSDSYKNFITANGIELGTRSIDFAVSVTTGTSSNVAIDLAALIDDIPQGQRMVYYAIAADGSLSPLTYNPRQGGGARVYDLNGNGRPDFLSLRLADGGYGDKDGTANGIIDDPSTAGSLELKPVFSRVGNQTLTAADPAKSTAPASLVLKASLTSRTSAANEIGYVVLDADELAGADTLLNDLGALRERAQLLFSSLESTDVVLPTSTAFTREFLLLNGQSVRFFQVTDATLDDLSSASDSRLEFFSTGDLSSDSTSLALSSPAGVRFNLELLNADQGLMSLIGQEQSLAPVLDFTAFTTAQRVVGTLEMGREADHDSVIGFYRTADLQGSVRDQNGNLLRPEDLGYKEAALLSENRVDALTGLILADNTTSTRSIELSETGYLAPFVQVQNNTFFAFAEANADRYGHIKMLGTNLFGVEDLGGGGDRDHDDIVFGFSFSQLVNPVA